MQNLHLTYQQIVERDALVIASVRSRDAADLIRNLLAGTSDLLSFESKSILSTARLELTEISKTLRERMSAQIQGQL